MKVSKRRFYLTSRYFRKNLHFQKCVTVRIGFGEGFEMKILPNIKIFHKNLYFQKRRAILEYELLTVGQDISQGRQQSANPEQSANQKRSFCRHLKTSSTTVHSTMEWSVAVHPILLRPNPTLTWNALQKQQNNSALENGMLCSSSLYSVVFQHDSQMTSITHAL